MHFRPSHGSSTGRFGPSGVTTKYYKRGDILWVPQSQDLSIVGDPNAVPYKTRPFVILQATVKVDVDAQGRCIKPVRLLGVAGTSKDFLVEGRPNLEFQIPGESVSTHIFIDCLRTVDCSHIDIRHHNWLPKQLMPELMDGLDQSLRPEKKFYLPRWFDKTRAPGQIWDYEVPTAQGSALILVRRGKFYTDDYDPEAAPEEAKNGQHPTRFTPYLVASFKESGIRTLRGVGWDDIEIRAVHERSLMQRQGELTEETVNILLNNLRERIGLKPLAEGATVFRSTFSRILWLCLLRKPGF